MTVRHEGSISSPQPLPGGSAQGCFLGILCFIVELSDSGMDVPPQPDPSRDVIDVHSLSHPQQSIKPSEIRQKYVDDQVQGELIDLNTDVHKGPQSFIGPRTYHDRHGLVNKDETLLQKRLNDISHHTSIHQMKINQEKTKIMPFNFTNKFDFVPQLKIDDRQLEVVYSYKLLRVVIQSDCKWSSKQSIW